jgi:hypothetical protein
MAAAAVTLAGALLTVDLRISRVAGGGGEFFAAWSGARGFLLQHTGPYEQAAAGLAQQLAYGRSAASGENPYILTTPFYLLPFYFPFALFSTAVTARAVWMCLSQLALAAGAFIVLRLIDWRRPRVFIVLYVLLSLFSYYSVAAMQEGTPVIILGLLYLGILWAYQNGRDELAGALLVLCLIRLEVGGPFLVVFVWRILHEKRWNIVVGFAMTLVVLLAISFLIYPGWVLPYLTATLAMIRAAFGVTTTAAFVHLSPQYGAAMAQAVTVVVISLLVYEAAAGRDSEFRRFVWISCLALAATPLMGFRTEISSAAVLYPSLALICAASLSRGRTGRLLTGIILVLALVIPWFTFARWSSLHDQRDYDYLFLAYPLLCTAGLYWTRWWFIHPQRTVFDEVRNAAN